MSKINTFIQEAIESCEIYSEYCKDNGKSQIVTKVAQITRGDTARSFVLHFEARSSLHSFDSEALCIYLDEDMMLPYSYYDDVSRHYVRREYFEFLTYLHKEQQLLISVKEERVLDLFHSYLIHHPERIRFISDMTFLIDKVKNWYDTYGKRIQMPESKSETTLPSREFVETLSDSQYQAVQTALTSPVSYIWGPPGTGKTWTLAHAVSALVRQGKRILIVAPTNNAIDNSLRTVLQVMEKKGDSIDQVIRCGIPTVSFEREYSEVCQSSALSKMIASYKKRIEECERLLTLHQEYDTFMAKATYFRQCLQQYRDELQEIDRGETRLREAESRCSAVLSRMEFAKNEAREASSVLMKHKQRAVSLKHISRMRFNEKYRNTYNRELAAAQANFDEKNRIVEEVNQEYTGALAQKQTDSEQVARSKTRSAEDLRQLEKLSVELVGSFDSLAVTEAVLYQRESEYSFLKSRDKIEAERQYCQEQLIEIDRLTEKKEKEKRVISCTIDHLYAHYSEWFDESDPMNPPMRIDHVFIDEAALLPLIKAGAAFSLKVPVTLCGDHKQLPPVCEMNDSLIEYPSNNAVFLWAQSALYFTDLFEHSMEELYRTYLASGDILNRSLSVSFLKDTFRFGHNLAQILDEFIYQNGFRGSSNPTEITIIDAPHTSSTVASRTSPDEVAALKEYLISNLKDDFVILTPYVKQRNLLRRELKNLVASSNIQTVHAAQGLEWNTVIISVVDADRPFFCNSSIQIGKKVLNTAISRTIKELVIVCDYAYWMTKNKQLIGALAENKTNRP